LVSTTAAETVEDEEEEELEELEFAAAGVCSKFPLAA